MENSSGCKFNSITSLTQLKLGAIYYRIGHGGHLGIIHIEKLPYKTPYGFIFIDVEYQDGRRNYKTDISLEDMNIPENVYNRHRLFIGLDEARLFQMLEYGNLI